MKHWCQAKLRGVYHRILAFEEQYGRLLVDLSEIPADISLYPSETVVYIEVPFISSRKFMKYVYILGKIKQPTPI